MTLAHPQSGPHDIQQTLSPLHPFALPEGVTSRALYERLLQKHKVVVKVVPTQWLNGNRISTHLFNTERDVDTLVEALKMALA